MAFANAQFQRVVAAEPPSSPRAAGEAHGGVLVLSDGGVLTGRISQSADRYIVARGGAEISIPVASVALVCGTLQEAYQRQRSAMQTPTAETHLKLAEWCLALGLYPQAAEELVAARGLDPRHPKLELLERRLAVVGRPAPEKNSTADISTLEKTSTRKSVQSPRSTSELPDGVVERFTRKVQPLLVNNCTTAGCHRPGSPQSFELDRSLLHGMANRRSTMHNLSAVLVLVDHERPQDSPLLTIPRRDHGGMNHPIFGPRHSSQFQQLVDWVAMVTQSTVMEGASPPADAGQNAEISVTPVRSPPIWTEPVEAASFEDALPPLTPAPLRYGAHLRPWEPKDPFDPEIFNRQSRATAEQPRSNAASSHE
ncbi:MAG: hypothetical protein WD468_06965 [Pirellulales bacterium]